MRTAICLLVKNEARDLLEWLAFQVVVGFDTVLVLDNRSTDATAAIVRQAGLRRDVRLGSWDSASPRSHADAYEAALEALGPGYDWVAFFDSDEFLVPLAHGGVKPFLRSLDAHTAIGVNWLVFGSSGLRDFPGRTVIESFRRRAPDGFGPHAHIKSIVRPSEVIGCVNSHFLHVRGARRSEDGQWSGCYVNAAGRPIEWARTPGISRTPPAFGVCRLQHYFTRSRAHWEAKKRRAWLDVTRDDSAFDEHDRNEVADDSALRFLPDVQREMALLR